MAAWPAAARAPIRRPPRSRRGWRAPTLFLWRAGGVSHNLVIMIRSSYRVLPCILALVAGCASSGGQQVYVAPTSETVYSGYEEMQAHPGQVMYVENRSSVPIQVYSVTLRSCTNIKQTCEVRPVNIRVGPNGHEVILRIEPEDPEKAYDFSASYAWRADSAPKAALGALSTAGDSQATHELAAIHQAEVRARHQVGGQDLDLTAGEVDSLGDRAGSLRVVPPSLVIRVGEQVPLDTLRVLLISTDGQTLGRVWAFRYRLPGDGVANFAKPSGVIGTRPGRTVLQLQLNEDVLREKPDLHRALEVPIVVTQK